MRKSKIIKTTQKPTKSSNPCEYVISLAWSEDKEININETIDKIREYFNDLNISELSLSHNNKEHVIKYEFKGSDKSFRIVKRSAQFLLDSISKTDYEKFNIAVYGKKKIVTI